MGCQCSARKIKIKYISPKTGCSSVGEKSHSEVESRSVETDSDNQRSRTKKNILYRLSSNSTSHIFDYLNFKELKEVGKVCSHFQRLSMNPDILKKFFVNQSNNQTLNNQNFAVHIKYSPDIEKIKKELVKTVSSNNSTCKTEEKIKILNLNTFHFSFSEGKS